MPTEGLFLQRMFKIFVHSHIRIVYKSQISYDCHTSIQVVRWNSGIKNLKYSIKKVYLLHYYTFLSMIL